MSSPHGFPAILFAKPSRIRGLRRLYSRLLRLTSAHRKECGSESPAVASSFYIFLLYKCTDMPQRPNAMRFKVYERGHPAFGGKTTRTQFWVASALQEALV
jgi:hypothetical protein